MNQEPEFVFLSSFRVLDLTDEKGCYCSKILADLGAEVIRIEKPGVEKNFWWWSYNANKTLVHMDIEKEREKVLQYVREADFLVESFPPGYLDSIGLGYRTLSAVNPRLIITSITPFGQTGPYKDFVASDLEVTAMSGVMYVLGDSDRPPLRIGFPQSYLVTSAEAAVGTLIAHCWREKTGEGQHVDVSAQECFSSVLLNAPYMWEWQETIAQRSGKYRFGVMGAMFPHPLIWECSDGHVAYMLQGEVQGAHSNRILVQYMEREGVAPDFLLDIQWENYVLMEATREDLSRVWGAFADFFRRHTRQELYQLALKEKILLFPLNTIEDVLVDGQLQARAFWQEQRIADLDATLKFPGPFAKVTYAPLYHKTEEREEERKNRNNLPFAGLKVADFSWIAAAPWMTQWLSEYGAEVIKIESATRLDHNRAAGPFKDDKLGVNRSAYFLLYNGGKKSITLNLNSSEGRKIARELVQWADIVVESFAPGQMLKWGLNYDELQKINPGLVMFSSSMMGATGPYAPQPGLGMMLTSLVGITGVTGWHDRDPAQIWGAYTDVLAARLGGAILMSALDYRRRTGKGCYLDISQYEVGIQFIAPLVLEYQKTGILRERMGNRSPEASPHGVFPCLGKDRWCAVSVYNDFEWQAFCGVIGEIWVRDPKFATCEGRKTNEDELEKRISEWTVQFTAQEAITQFQQAGVQAGLVQDCSDLYQDPQLLHRKHFVSVNHPELGEYDHFCSGFRLEKVPSLTERSPCLGEHNEYVYKSILGMSEEEFDICRRTGVFK